MRTLNPAIKFVTLLGVTFVLAFRYEPALNLAVFFLCMAALLCSRVKLKTLGILLVPILLAAVGMFFTGLPIFCGCFYAGGSSGFYRQ